MLRDWERLGERGGVTGEGCWKIARPDRIWKVETPTGTHVYQYNAHGQVINEAGPGMALAIEHNTRGGVKKTTLNGKVTEVTEWLDTPAHPYLMPKRITFPGGSVQHTFDASNFLITTALTLGGKVRSVTRAVDELHDDGHVRAQSRRERSKLPWLDDARRFGGDVHRKSRPNARSSGLWQHLDSHYGTNVNGASVGGTYKLTCAPSMGGGGTIAQCSVSQLNCGNW